MSWDDEDDMLRMDVDVKKERGTTDRSGKYMKFDEYYDSVGKSVRRVNHLQFGNELYSSKRWGYVLSSLWSICRSSILG